MVLNIPANLESFEQWTIPTSDIYSLSSPTLLLETCQDARIQEQESPSDLILVVNIFLDIEAFEQWFFSTVSFDTPEPPFCTQPLKIGPKSPSPEQDSESSPIQSTTKTYSSVGTSTEEDLEDGLDIPTDIEALEQLDLSTPCSTVFDPSPFIKPLEFPRRTPSPEQEHSPLPAPAPELDYSDTESTISSSSSYASSIKSSSTAATSTFDDQEATKAPAVPSDAKPLPQQPTASSSPVLSSTSLIRSRATSRRSSTSSSTSAASSVSNCTSTSRRSTGQAMPQALPSVESSNYRAVTRPLSTDSSRVGSTTGSPVSQPRGISPAPSENSGRSLKSCQSDPPLHVIVAPFERRSPKPDSVAEQTRRSRPASIAVLEDKALGLVPGNASTGSRLSQNIPPSPCYAEPPSAWRRTFGHQISAGPHVKLQLALLNVTPPHITPKSEVPPKSVRFTTRK